MAAQQSPLGYGFGALAGNGILYAFPGRWVERGAQRVLYPLAGIPGGAFFTSLMGQSASDLLIQSSETIARGVQQGMSADVQVQKQPGMKFGVADFRSAGLVRMTVELPEDMWKLSDAEQFKWLDAQIGDRPAGYVWHHSENPGRMELVPYGVHNIVAHNGGRSPGMWAYIPK